MTKVLISDSMDPRAAAIFRERGIHVDEITGKTPDELAAIIGDYDGLAIRSSTKVTPAILAAATRLKVVGRAGIGVDNVDIPAATARGVVVMNTPFGNSITTAEHAIALMFAAARQIAEWPRLVEIAARECHQPSATLVLHVERFAHLRTDVGSKPRQQRRPRGDRGECPPTMGLANMAIRGERDRIDQPHRADLRTGQLAGSEQSADTLNVHPEQRCRVSHDHLVVDHAHHLTLL